jgi:acyl-CoA thioester hydrolase
VGEIFRHRLRVRYHECDPQAIVFNAHYLAYFDLAVTELWRETMGGLRAMFERGLDFVVAEVRIRYRSPLRFDDEFDVCLSIAELRTTAMRTEATVERDGLTAADGELRQVLIDPGTGEKTPIPDDVREVLGRYTASQSRGL